MFCTFVFANHGLIFYSCEGNNNRDGLKTLVVHTFTNCQFVGVASIHVRTITSRTSLNHGFEISQKTFVTLDLGLIIDNSTIFSCL